MKPASPRTGATVRVERLAARSAGVLWPLMEQLGARLARPAFRPPWAPEPLVRTAGRTMPPSGWPRTTDSLCPECVKRLRREVLDGTRSLDDLRRGKLAEIPATVLERDGRIVVTKTCPEHGTFEDVLSIDPAFLARIERLFPGRDYEARAGGLRDHGSSSIRYGRGSVLTVDLTNRCNLRCDPCFMAANRSGGAHDLGWNEIQRVLDASLRVVPRRQMSVQFSGGEPTLSPHFLDAIRYARTLGYFCVQCASNGVRFANDPGLCREAKRAGLRLCYLQFDGVTDAAYASRHVSAPFAMKQRAIDNLHAAGVDVVLVPTIVGGQNADQVGEIVRFAIDNADKVTVVSFQPVSFSGCYEDVPEPVRRQQRYTLSHLVHDIQSQTGLTEPLRDWFPLASMNPFTDVVDLLLGPDAPFGALKCGCHPHCGVGTVLLVHKATKQVVPLGEVLDLPQLLEDLSSIADAGRGRRFTVGAVGLSVLRNLRPERLPAGYGLPQLVRQLLSQIGAAGSRIGQTEGDSHDFEWRLLFVAGMWFQDLYNFDFRRTEMCIIPYGTSLGEISFCAYNTGIGWRHFVERFAEAGEVTAPRRGDGREPAPERPRPRTPWEGQPSAFAFRPGDGRKRLPIIG
jgi:7,8-dihydro-6-hydroxymethylpterin dimethyltransferase